jgi:hypothetical protein
LNDVGKFYDQARGYIAFEPTLPQTAAVLAHFSSECCYCGEPLQVDRVVWDHLIPVDKSALGLHAWGNVVPCCQCCLTTRQRRTWREFLVLRAGTGSAAARAASIERFVGDMRYDLNLNLHPYADTLYEDIGAIATTLVQLRYKQAEQKLRAMLAGEPTPRSSKERRVNFPVKTE